MDAHNAAVLKISSRIKQFHSVQKPFRLYHGSTNSTRASNRSLENTVDTSALNHIIHVDKVARTATVEPNVAMDKLVEATIPFGLVPPVVMEFPGITVGGGFAGTSGESSSFRYGAFDTTINEIEVVLPDGQITRASKKEKPDLFWGSASAFGTLGVVTLLEIQLIEAKKYVALTYSLERSASDTASRMKEECGNETNDYVDGIVFSKDSALICVGRMTDDKPEGQPARTFSRRKDPWFYNRACQVEEKLRRDAKEHQMVDYIPLADYLFRYDRGGFWVAYYAFRYFLTPFNRVTRYLLDGYMHAREMYQAVHSSGLADFYMVQDIGVPVDSAPEFQAWLDSTYHIYPLWLCPLKIRRTDADSSHGIHAHFSRLDTPPDLMNFGLWGPLKGRSNSRKECIRQNRLLEDKVHKLGGKKWLYAQAFYTEEEFWANYDKENYEALRKKYGAEYLPSVYDKIKTDLEREERQRSGTAGRRLKTAIWSIWPLRGLYGFWKTAARPGGDYLLGKS